MVDGPLFPLAGTEPIETIPPAQSSRETWALPWWRLLPLRLARGLGWRTFHLPSVPDNARLEKERCGA